MNVINKQDKHEGIHSINLLQVNIRGIRANFDEFKKLLLANNVDIALIQETWLQNHDLPPTIDGYLWIGNNRANRLKGGVGIFISRRLRFHSYQFPTKIKFSFFLNIPNTQTKSIT